MENGPSQGNIFVDVKDIVSKCKTKVDRINICRELGKSIH